MLFYLSYYIHSQIKVQVKKSEFLVMGIMKRFCTLAIWRPTIFQFSVSGIVETIFADFVGQH